MKIEEGINLDSTEIKAVLHKSATVFKTGGFRPTYSIEESWLGAVPYSLEEEELPLDGAGLAMIPLLQVNLASLPYVPEVLQQIKVISVFVSPNFKPEGDNLKDYFCIREYATLKGLLLTNRQNKNSELHPFPLLANLVEDDSPMWDSEDIPMAIVEAILVLEEQTNLAYFDDIATIYSETKVGGYGSYIQGNSGYPSGYEFAFQLSSDAKANLNIIDDGSFYFLRNPLTGD